MPVRFKELVEDVLGEEPPAREAEPGQPRAQEMEPVASPAEAREVEEVSLPEPRGYFVGTVTRIEYGRIRDFMDVEKVAESLRRRYGDEEAERFLRRADDPAYRFTITIPELGMVVEKTVRVSFSPKSKLMKMLKLYGERTSDGRLVIRRGAKVVVKLTETPEGRVVSDIEVEDVSAVKELLSS